MSSQSKFDVSWEPALAGAVFFKLLVLWFYNKHGIFLLVLITFQVEIQDAWLLFRN